MLEDFDDLRFVLDDNETWLLAEAGGVIRVFDLFPDLLLVLLINERVVEWLEDELEDTFEDMDSLELIDSFSSLLLVFWWFMFVESMLADTLTACWLLFLVALDWGFFIETVSWPREVFLERIMYLERLVESDEEEDEDTVEMDDLLSSGWVSLTSFLVARVAVKSSE